MIEGYVTEDIELDEGDEVSVLAQPDLLNVYIEDVSTTKLSSLYPLQNVKMVAFSEFFCSINVKY